jgi:hypothetical protein
MDGRHTGRGRSQRCTTVVALAIAALLGPISCGRAPAHPRAGTVSDPVASEAARSAVAGFAAPSSAAASAGQPAKGSQGCGSISNKLVPSCGAWLGIWPRTRADGTVTSDLTGNLSSIESRLGRQLNLASRYYGWTQLPPDATDNHWRDTRHLVVLDLRARNFSTNTYVSWQDIASGSQDGYLQQVAARVRSFGTQVFFSFNQEPEQELEKGTQVAGTARDYAAAYRHIHDVFERVGASNVVWLWWTMGCMCHTGWYHDLYPGDSYVDWIGYDPYDFNTCHSAPAKTPAQTVLPFVNWLASNGLGAGKPLMLSEFGSNGTAQGAWYRDMAQVIKATPRIKAIVSFNSNPGGCDTRVTASPDNWQGFASLAGDGYFNQPS